jgi:hypothetical protein
MPGGQVLAIHPAARRGAPLWEITEQQVQTTSPDGREERCTAVLSAWSAHSEHDLSRYPGLGFGAAAAALAALAGQDPFVYGAEQAAVARYSRTGFEAGAITGMGVGAGIPAQPRKCHKFETDHGDFVVRQPRKPRSRTINMSRTVRPYTTRSWIVAARRGR